MKFEFRVFKNRLYSVLIKSIFCHKYSDSTTHRSQLKTHILEKWQEKLEWE